MTAIIQRFKMVIIAISFIILALIGWLVLSRQNANKIPSRGVFVTHTAKFKTSGFQQDEGWSYFYAV